MTVDAVNQANVAGIQQQQNRASGLPLGSNLVLGAAGAGAGYLFGGRKPSLEEVFAQDPDTFESTMKKIGEKDAEVAKTLKAERLAIYGDANVRAKNNALQNKTVQISSEVQLRNDYANKTELDKAVSDAKDELANLAKDATDAEKSAAQAKLKEAEQAVFDAKLEKFNADPATKALRDEFNVLESEFTTALNESIGKSAQKDTVKEAFGNVKKVLIEGKGKAAAIWGGIALLSALALGTIFGGSKRPEVANQQNQ